MVLFEFLNRIDETKIDGIFEDKSKQLVLWNVSCQLESSLVEPCYKNYDKVLKQSRENVKKAY